MSWMLPALQRQAASCTRCTRETEYGTSSIHRQNSCESLHHFDGISTKEGSFILPEQWKQIIAGNQSRSHSAKLFLQWQQSCHLCLTYCNSEPYFCDILMTFALSVAGKGKEEEPWMARHLRVPYLLYEADNTRGLHHHWGVGNEAMSYLQFIAQHYECLPEVSLIWEIVCIL